MSLLRMYPVISQTTKFQKTTTPSYFDGNLFDTVPIPFIYNNNVLDINIQDNVQTDLIDNGSTPDANTNPQCKTFGGTGLVLNLGPNMLLWLSNLFTNQYGGSISNIVVNTPGQVIKAQYTIENADQGSFLRSDVDDSTYAITSMPPSADEYVTGTPSNNYRSVWIFKTPLTISFDENGTVRYLTLFTNYSGND